jgi:hypothetical protein
VARLLLETSSVNRYLAHKQHLLPASRLADVVAVTRNIVALHATDAVAPYLSLWARDPDFGRAALEDALYENRSLAKVLCMRVTMHAVPSDELPFFFQAYDRHRERSYPAEFRSFAGLLVRAGICGAQEAEARLDELQRQVLDVLGEKGPSTVQQISRAVPELKAKVAHDEGKAYAGEFSIGSRLVPRMCAEGLLIRARPRGTWRSNLYEYALLSDWLPEVNLESGTPQQARVWLVRRYLAAFGPATYSDVQWWTGFSKAETKGVLEELEPELVESAIEGISNGYLMLAGDAGRLGAFTGPQSPYVFFLPALDPYIMGYQGRRRFLNSEHRAKVFDRAGNAQPTVWVDGRAVGAWGQSQDGSVIYRLFEPVCDEAQELLASEARRLEIFLDGEVIRPRSQTPFTRALGHR